MNNNFYITTYKNPNIILLRVILGFLYVIFLTTSATLFGQVESNISEGDSLYQLKEYEKAYQVYNQVINDEKVDIPNQLKLFLKKGNTQLKLKDQAKAISNYDDGIQFAKENNYSDSLITASLLFKKGVALYYSEKYNEAIKEYNHSLDVRKKLLDPNHLDISFNYFNIGGAYEYLGNTDKAIEYYLKSLEVRKNLKKEKYILKCYRRLGRAYEANGDYTRAEEFYNYTLEQQIKMYGVDDYENAKSYFDLGNNYFKQAALDKAISYYNKAISIYKIYDDTQGEIAKTYSNIGNVLIEKGEIKKASIKYQESLSLNKEIYGLNSEEYLYTLTNIGVAEYEQKRYKEAIQTFIKTQDIAINIYGDNHPEVANTLLNQADTWQKMNQPEKAIAAYNNGVNILTNRMGKFIILEPNEYINALDKELLLLLIKGHAETLEQTSLEEALKYYQLFVQITDQMRQNQTAEASKIFWSGELLPVFEKGVDVCYDLYYTSRNDTYIHTAFEFFEKSKNITLLESIKEQDALELSGISEEIILRLNQLDQEISDLEKEKFKSKENDTNLSKKIIELRQEKQSIISNIEASHPKYYQLKYNTFIEPIYRDFNNDETVITYFLGDSSLYNITLNQDILSFTKIKITKNKIANKVQLFLEGMYEYQFSENRTTELYESSAKKYTENAFELYQILFNHKYLESESLIIIPDGVLGYLPFEALLTQKSETPTDFRNHHYLVKEQNISYAYSVAMHREMKLKTTRPNKNKILAYAPQFHQQQLAKATEMDVTRFIRSGLSELVYNTEEVKSVKKIFKTDIKSGDSASKNHFLNNGEDYRVLHFATHGKTDDENSSYSYLAFSHMNDNDSDEHLLYVKDLYQMNLNADMVVLSACETGIGKLKKGEGIISLSRGFSYAGAKSLVNTLWSVNDVQTSKLITLFYQFLGENESKNLALTHAKREFIKTSTPQFAHPYYWAAPILIGDTAPLEIGTGIPWLWIGVGLLILGLGFLGFRKWNSN